MAKAKPKVTLVIPVRGVDSLLGRTVDCAISGAINDVEVLIVDNGYEGVLPKGKGIRVIKCDEAGTGQARHAGVMAARANVVVTVDAHVKLCTMWDDYVLEHFDRRNWNKTIACGFVGGIDADFIVCQDPCYKGATIHMFDDTRNGETRPFVAKWDDRNQHGRKIGAVMGAFYAFKKSWYKRIGEPWSVLHSWGCDEELISVASWLNGGDCRLMDKHVVSWHLFSRPEVVDYMDEERAMIALNRFVLFSLFPFSDLARDKLRAEFAEMGEVRLSDRQIEFAAKYADKKPELERYLQQYVVGYDDWMATAQTVAVDKPVQVARPPQRLEMLPEDVCDRCDAVGTFRCYSTEARVRRYRCKACGRKAWRPRDGGRLKFTICNN